MKINNIFFGVSALALLGILMGVSQIKQPTFKKLITPQINKTVAPEVSGWIAWWAEDTAYDLVASNPGKIKSVSPVWFMAKENLELENIGKIDRASVIETLKLNKVRILPSIGSEIPGEKLGKEFRNSSNVDNLINNIVEELIKLDVDGLDVDIEGVRQEDRNYFTTFLTKLSKKLKENNLFMSIAVHAQTGKNDWDGMKGQDLTEIGKIVDEVRIMTYDQHSGANGFGPISSYNWIADVAVYNTILIPKNKIVMGIPSYGYVWTKDETRGLQYDEFQAYLAGKIYNESRDQKSGEIVFTNDKFKASLSDSDAMVSKINLLKSLGFNRFIIWHLGGMDERFFDKLETKETQP